MTDSDIIKALECCSDSRSDCSKCPCFGAETKEKITCELKMIKNALDLINRQKADIERLTINMNAFGLGMIREKEQADIARTEAVKDFAERLKEYLDDFYHTGEDALLDTTDVIDNLVKEMVGEGK